ncbi:hypothetical protein VOLCADRAFT_107275 [Volvox carteri f. nagariensis]|uniref:HNH nuclease domain-containing protein n=1 Tax=Volvox carteri f. nagariensis TaxID=3068 RepID=D8UCX5_VOLCA|nr:uncharacterized protein VOLCADRAFT_107275 [Volvox carteri f. nagariensis]EFJ42466.1 hypothetical protein VOLCADRAFT_107275 [Volvox carteri f. nagariensis]|eukprot:XP_002956529.1 hypothetical protein VOLCADRAFT_107275 [Volvox carteri f. nagariensis]
MVSRKEAAAAFTAAAKALDVRGKELGDLCFALSKLSGEELEVFPIDGDNEAIVEFMRSVKASAAGLGMGSAAGAALIQPTHMPFVRIFTMFASVVRSLSGDADAAAGLGVGSAPRDVVLERLEKLEETLGEKIREENLQLEEKLKLELGEKIREENLQLEKLKLKLGEELGEIQEEIRDQSQFVRVLMQGDITATSSKDSTPYRENAFRYYGYSASPKTVKCMVTGKDMPAASIKAGHIFRQGWNRGYLPLLGVTSVHDPRNIILVRTEVETAFDRFEVAIIPQNEGYQGSALGWRGEIVSLWLAKGPYSALEKLSDPLIMQIYVLKKSLLDNPREKYIGTGDAAKLDTLQWEDVHKKYLHVAGDNLPARRLLAFHAHHAVKYAVSAGWQEPGEVIVSQAGWASPGYDRDLMRKLAAAGCCWSSITNITSMTLALAAHHRSQHCCCFDGLLLQKGEL